jgi:Clp amino terminal domain, pathogenicity island component
MAEGRKFAGPFDRMGTCARKAWDDAVAERATSTVARPSVTTGHLLVGVLTAETCAGGLILGRMHLDFKVALATTRFVLVYGRKPPADTGSFDRGGFPHSSAAKSVLDFAYDEAELFSSTYPIGTEHLLLGLLRVPDSIGYRVLHHFGIDEARARAGRDELWDVLKTVE